MAGWRHEGSVAEKVQRDRRQGCQAGVHCLLLAAHERPRPMAGVILHAFVISILLAEMVGFLLTPLMIA